MVDSVQAAPANAWESHYPADVDYHAPLPQKPLSAVLDEAVARFPNRPCIDFLGKRYCYAEIGALVERAACGLQALGVGKGVRVGLFLPNTPYFVIAYYAVLKAGGTVVNFNPLYVERELREQIDDSGVALMITLDLSLTYDKMAGLLGKGTLQKLIICPMTGILPFPKNLLFPLAKRKDLARIPQDDRHIPWSRLIARAEGLQPVAIDPATDIALLQYTGGTTGTPKGAMLTHANLYANTLQSAFWFGAARPGEEKMLGVLPLFHVFAMTVVMNLGLRLGAELVLLPRFDLGQVIKTIDRKKITLFPAVPTIYTAISNQKNAAQFDLSSIRYCFSGGAPLPVDVKEKFERLTGCVLVEGYGLSESSPVATGNPLNGINKPGSIGLPIPGTIIEIISLEDGVTPVPSGQPGEVCIRGPQVMAGYWNRPQETATTLRNGRLHTGDIGYLDEDGYTFIIDRLKDMIIASGFNIYPRNVEEQIQRHPAVAEVVVAGLPDIYRGQTVKAYIKLVEGATLTHEELTAFLADKLSPLETPKLVEFRTELPKTMIGKLSRKALLEEEAARGAKGA